VLPRRTCEEAGEQAPPRPDEPPGRRPCPVHRNLLAAVRIERTIHSRRRQSNRTMTAAGPDIHRVLFRRPRRRAVALLGSLSPADWERPTVAGAWKVKDVAAHLLDGKLRKLSFHRDGPHPPAPPFAIKDDADLVRYLNGLNAEWVEVARRFSPAGDHGDAGGGRARGRGLRGTARPGRPVALPGGLGRRGRLDELDGHGPRIHRALAPPGPDPRGGGSDPCSTQNAGSTR
jgi:hypothetical protein